MQQERLIRKYSNRRLYDTGGSRHVTLEDLRQLIVAGEKIKVIDDKSGEDLTRSVLLQIISEQEQFGSAGLGLGIARDDHPLLWPSDASAAQPLSRTGLHHHAAAAGDRCSRKWPRHCRRRLRPLTELARKNMELWEQMQAATRDAFMRPRARAAPNAADPCQRRRTARNRPYRRTNRRKKGK